MTTYLVPMLEFLNPERLWFLAVVLAIIVAFAWALHGGQFDDLQDAGRIVLEDDVTERSTP